MPLIALYTRYRLFFFIEKQRGQKYTKFKRFFSLYKIQVYLAGSSLICGGIFVVPYAAEQFAKNISGDSNRVSIGWDGGGPTDYWAASSVQQLKQPDLYLGLVGNDVLL